MRFFKCAIVVLCLGIVLCGCTNSAKSEPTNHVRVKYSTPAAVHKEDVSLLLELMSDKKHEIIEQGMTDGKYIFINKDDDLTLLGRDDLDTHVRLNRTGDTAYMPNNFFESNEEMGEMNT